MAAGTLAGVGLPLALAAVFGGGFLVNEWSQGTMAEAMGLGHHHALDPGPGHCAQHAHLHSAPNGTKMPGGHCGDMAMQPMPPGSMPGTDHHGGVSTG